MAYTTEVAKFGRIPTVFIELDMDFCALRSGIGECTATQTGDDKCYNTYSTCNDKPNFDKTVKTYRFCEQNADIPVGLSAIPLLKTVTFASQEITPNKGLGVRGSVNVTFLDAPWPDTEIDPYFRERTYNTNDLGTFWGKFRARNPYYENRVLRVRRGYLTKSAFDWTNFVNSVYVIDQLQCITKDDGARIVAKDILKLADDKKALFPKPSNGVLSSNITNSTTSFTIEPSGIGSEYPASGKVVIGGEMMSFTRSGEAFTVTREVSNTVAEAHNAGDTVQLVGIFNSEKIQDVIYTLLTSYSSISTDYIDKDAWDTEATTYLAGVWSAEIPEPTGINTLVGELTEQGTCRIWWDEENQLIQFRAVKPLPEDLTVLSDDDHFLTNSIDVKTDTNQRISTVLVYYGQKKPTEKLDDVTNYPLRVATPDLDAISSLEYGTNITKKIYSRWFKNTSTGRVNALADALLKTYRNPPQIIEFNLTPALQLKVGDLFNAYTRKMQNLQGAKALVPMEVVWAQPLPNDEIKYKAQEVSTAIPISNTYKIIFSDSLYESLNLYDAFVDEYGEPEAGITVEFEILTGVMITGATTSDYALTNPDTWPSDVTLKITKNLGIIVGRGANGVKGVDILDDVPPTFSTPQNGLNGGVALLIEYPIDIDNTGGIISGGGGSGGAGEAIYSGFPLNAGVAGSGSGGGWPFGLAGPKGEVSVGVVGAVDGNDGQAANTTDAGLGGTGVTHATVLTGGYGGDGGKYADGTDGGAATGTGATSGYGTKGLLGDAIHGDSLITWTATGTIYGDIVA